MIELARKYAALKKTAILAHAMKPNGSICFVLESGPKLTMSKAELEQAIAELQDNAAPAVIDTRDGIDAAEASAAGAALRQRRKK